MKLARIILTSLSISLFSLSSYGQSPGSEKEDHQSEDQFFELVKTIPDTDSRIVRRPAKVLEDIVFGKSDIRISRPSDIIPGDPGKGWILSQENGEIIYYDANGIRDAEIKRRNRPVFKSMISGCYVPGTGLFFTDSASDQVYVLRDDGSLEIFTDKELVRPTGIAYNKANQTIWIVETGAHTISIFNISGELIKQIGERGTGPGQFNFPAHIDIDDHGKVYVVDAMNFRIQIFSDRGIFVSQFGEQGDASGKFASPKGIVVDSQQNIFVADALFNNIQVFDEKGNFLFYFGSRGGNAYEFLMPSGLGIDENDYIYVSDTYNNRIQVFKPTFKEHDK